MKAIRKRLTYANVMSSLAVFLVLGGGAAFAAINLPKNSIGTRELKPKAVKTGILARNAVKTGKVGPEAIKAGKLAKNAVPTNRLRDNAVITNKIANDAVTGDKVIESTLGIVPDASKLGGKSPGEYVGKSELLWALVDADAGAAAIVRSQGATAASSPGTGRYLVTFNRDITGCGMVATLGDATGTTGSPGEISLDQPVGDSVEVNTYDSAGAAQNPLGTNGFYIQVTC